MPERLQKIIAGAGVASRRKAEELIAAGRVSVNGEVVTAPGSKADPAGDRILVDGKLLEPAPRRRYFAVNKPKGCVATTSDPQGRRTVMDLLDKRDRKGLYPVGRLDYNTEGLLLLTNDGDFANRILSAANGITKTYEVKVSGVPAAEQIDKLRRGVRLDGRLAAPVAVRMLRRAKNPWYEVELAEGRNRQIHRMFQSIGFLVEKIRRVRIGTLALGDLPPGKARELRPAEIRRLLAPPLRRKSRPGASARRRRPERRRGAAVRRVPAASRAKPLPTVGRGGLASIWYALAEGGQGRAGGPGQFAAAAAFHRPRARPRSGRLRVLGFRRAVHLQPLRLHRSVPLAAGQLHAPAALRRRRVDVGVVRLHFVPAGEEDRARALSRRVFA